MVRISIPLPIPEGLYHGKLLESLTGEKLGPIENLRAPDVGGIQNLEPMLAGVLFETLGDDLLDLVATPKPVGLIRDFLKCRQIEQLAQCRKMRHGQRQITVGRVVNSVRRRQVGVRIAVRTSPRWTSPVIQVCGEHFKLEIQQRLNQTGFHQSPSASHAASHQTDQNSLAEVMSRQHVGDGQSHRRRRISSSPLSHMIPERACASRSCPGRSRQASAFPYPDTIPYTKRLLICDTLS